VASGDYSTANADAQQAYQQSETVAGEGGPDNTDETWTAQLDESWANSDQQTADQDAQTADSYAAAGFTDDAQMYGQDAQSEEQTADSSAESGQYATPWARRKHPDGGCAGRGRSGGGCDRGRSSVADEDATAGTDDSSS